MSADTEARPLGRRNGRPFNLFSMPGSDFKLWLGARQWSDSYAPLLRTGATGLTKDEHFMLDLVPVTGLTDFLYVRLRSSDNSVDFSFPGVMRASVVDQLLKVWELEDVKWCDGPALSYSGFPGTFTFPRELAKPTAQPVWMLVFETKDPTGVPVLLQRAGWASHFNKKEAQVRRLGCLMGPRLADTRRLINVLPALEGPGAFDLQDRKVATRACLEAGADYFERKLFTPAPGKMVQWKPHAQLLGIDQSVYGELVL